MIERILTDGTVFDGSTATTVTVADAGPVRSGDAVV
jgi:hypothetical protein